MLKLDYFPAIIIALLIFFIAWVLSQVFAKRKHSNWKDKFQSSESELKELRKKMKNENLQVNQFKSKTEQWKNEFHILKQEFQHSQKKWDDDKQTFIEGQEAQAKELKAFNNELQAKERITKKLQNDLDNLKKKYQTDIEDYTNWKRDKAGIVKENENQKVQIDKLKSLAKDLQTQLNEQKEAMESWREMERNIKMLKIKNKKLGDDISYWEKKHYDTHHELAQLKKTHEGSQSEFTKLVELRKGDEILKSNLLKQIQEFKSKFLDISDKYRDLKDRLN